MNRFYLIGLDDNRRPFFLPEVKEIIASHQIFSGGLRHREIMTPYLPKSVTWIDITVPLDKVFEQYAAYDNKASIVVFASGDPLFFGFAATIRQRLPGALIRLYPSFHSLQKLAHALLLPYHDMRIVSLTGRPWHALDQALIEETAKIGILTDRAHTPTAIARRLLAYGYDNYTIYTGEHLGNPEKQNIRQFALATAAMNNFETPNCVILVKEKEGRRRPFGIPDDQFALLDGRTKMITKMPIRLLTLHFLDLGHRSRMWDVGFCTGSVSIEAKLRFPHLQITAFEIRPEGRELMETNSRRFGTPGIETVTGDFCEADLASLEAPDAVFIGGHGGKLPQMLARITAKLAPGGVVVFNSVSEESKQLFTESARQAGLQLEPPTTICVDHFNPITILKAQHGPAADGRPNP